jgi:hypothetical protein
LTILCCQDWTLWVSEWREVVMMWIICLFETACFGCLKECHSSESRGQYSSDLQRGRATRPWKSRGTPWQDWQWMSQNQFKWGGDATTCGNYQVSVREFCWKLLVTPQKRLLNKYFQQNYGTLPGRYCTALGCPGFSVGAIVGVILEFCFLNLKFLFFSGILLSDFDKNHSNGYCVRAISADVVCGNRWFWPVLADVIRKNLCRILHRFYTR